MSDVKKDMESWFYMRPGFSTFMLEPTKHSHVLLSKKDREDRDRLLREVEGATYSNEGFKAVIYGDFGRGKTHLAHNLVYLAKRRHLRVVPIYIKSGAYVSKEPFHTLFKEFVSRLGTEELRRVAIAYNDLVKKGKAQPLGDVTGSEDIALVMDQGLITPNVDVVKACIRWLGGEKNVEKMAMVSGSLKAQLADSREFGAVLKGLSQMLASVDGKVPMYLVDESERFQNVLHADTQYQWLAALRELTELSGVGFIFLVGAKTKNDLPIYFQVDEIVRRIGTTNYHEIFNPGREGLREFVLELLATCIRKGGLPEAQAKDMPEEVQDASVPKELNELTAGDAKKLEAFPFEPEALDLFIEQLATGNLASKPSEALIRVQKCARRAMLEGLRTITPKIVEQADGEGL